MIYFCSPLVNVVYIGGLRPEIPCEARQGRRWEQGKNILCSPIEPVRCDDVAGERIPNFRIRIRCQPGYAIHLPLLDFARCEWIVDGALKHRPSQSILPDLEVTLEIRAQV